MADGTQRYTITHLGNVLGDDMVTLSQNQVSPQRESAIIEFECPRKFERIEFVGSRDPTRFVPRTMQSITGTANDDTVVDLNNDIQPVSGETDIDDQDYPVCVAYNVTQDTQVDIVDVDYATNSVTLGSDPADGDTVKLYPIIADGSIQMEGVNQFNQVVGSVDNWPTPIYRFHDFKQAKRGTEVNLDGAADWSRYEKLRITLDSPTQLVWEDDHYPLGQYVSTIEQDVEITL